MSRSLLSFDQQCRLPAYRFRAAAVEDGADVQCCRECGAKLLTYEADGDDNEWYAAGTLVWIDCPGPGHSYPKKSKKASAKKK